MTVTTLCTGRTVTTVSREEALANYYSAERNAGADPLVANERMMLFAKSLDQFEADLEIIRQCIGAK